MRGLPLLLRSGQDDGESGDGNGNSKRRFPSGMTKRGMTTGLEGEDAFFDDQLVYGDVHGLAQFAEGL